MEKRRERFVKCRSALESLGKKFNEVRPDAVVILGNDQREFFNPGLTPSITIYRGSTISNVQHLNEDAPGLNIAEPANSPAEGATYPGAAQTPNVLTNESQFFQQVGRPNEAGAWSSAIE